MSSIKSPVKAATSMLFVPFPISAGRLLLLLPQCKPITLLPPVLCQSGRYKTVAKDVRLNRMPAFIFKASKTNRITGDEPALPGRMGVFSHTATKLAWLRAFFFS
ncbi:hypothetical protein [Rothia aeria]|uniref:hypothetical protein n=1 Tax=Rothia aeria TaxID=172042 RepID=UPI0018CAB14B|nr:hypothetical protein [Rothia aeria]